MLATFSRDNRITMVLAAALAVLIAACTQSASSDGSAGGTSGGTGGGTTSDALGTGGAPPPTGGTTNTGGYGDGSGGRGTGGETRTTGGTTSATGGSTTGNGGRTTNTGGSAGRTGAGGTGGSSTGGNGSGGVTADAGADAAPDGDDLLRDGAPDKPGDVSTATDGGSDSRSSDGSIAVPEGYRLVWSDEFDTDGTPNAKNWNYEKGFVRNNELQWYQANNATVKDGLLVIEGRKERVANPNYQAGSSDWKTSRQYADYTSTSMTTSGLQSWQYGRFEMRAKIPTSTGMWPAWWTLGVSGEWPSNGEIDIMEFYKGNVLANVACGTATRWTAKWDSSTKSLSSLGGSTWAAAFHVWRMDWDDQKIDLYLDDALMNSVTLSSMLNADGTSPFKQKVYMILNLAIGGDNGGDPSGTSFPQQYLVDYVRVFQKL